MAERPEDLNLPNAVVTRIIKDAIPEGVAVSKEARLAISKAASVFILYATSCSNNFALKGKRKTINAQDVLSAMEDMEFEQFIEPLQQCQEAFRQEKSDKKTQKKERAILAVGEQREQYENNNSAEDKNNSSVVHSVDDDDEEEEPAGGEEVGGEGNPETISNGSSEPEVIEDAGE